MGETTLDELAALGEGLLAGMARMRETVDAMGQSLTALEQTTAELRQDVTRLGERLDRLDRLEPRVDRIELGRAPRRLKYMHENLRTQRVGLCLSCNGLEALSKAFSNLGVIDVD